MKSYEGIFIVRADLQEDKTAKVAEEIAGEVAKAGGTVTERTLSQKQRLAYKIRKHDDGHCLILRFGIEQAALDGLNKRLKMNPGLLRHMITVYTPPPAKPPAPGAPAPEPAKAV